MTAHLRREAGSIVDRVHRLAPLVAQHREALDRERRLPQPVFDALVEADLLRLWAPRSLGGAELSPRDFLAAVEAAAAIDGSLGWILGNGAGMSRIAGYVGEPVARAWFGGPRCFVASATGAIGSAVPVDGGYRVSGRWPFGSGIHHATQVMALCAVPGAAEGEDLRCCVLPARDVAIIDTWHVSGLRGTGSCDFAAENVFVPHAHTFGLLAHEATHPGPLYRLANVTIFPFTVAVVPLGIARSAIDAFVTLAGRKVRADTALRDREIVQSEVGRAEALHGAARAFLIAAIEGVVEAVAIGGTAYLEARATARAAYAHAAESAVRIVAMMAAAGGAATIFETSPIERCARDVQAAVKHIAMSPNNYVVRGRVALGLGPGTARL